MDVLTPQFQSEVVKAALQDTPFLVKARPHLAATLFKSREERDLLMLAVKFFDQYQVAPSRGSVGNILAKSGAREEDVEGILERYVDVRAQDIDYLANSLLEFVRKQRYKDSLVKSMDFLSHGKYEDIYREIRELNNQFESTDTIGVSLHDMVEPALHSLNTQEFSIPTGFHDVDEKLFGGPTRGTQNVILTPPNSGKTTALINIGKFAALRGFRVAHLTTEISSLVTSRRYMMSFLRMDKQAMKRQKRTAYERMMEILEPILKENLIIHRFSPGANTVKDCTSWLNRIRNEFGPVDVFIMDMPQYLKSAKNYKDKRHEYSEVYTDLRALAVDLNLVQWVAHQTNRTGKGEETVTTSHLAEDFGIAGITDVILSLNQTLEDKRSGVGWFYFAKSRDDESGARVEIAIDWTKGWMGNLAL